MIVTTPAPVPQKCQKTFSDLPPELLDDIFGYISWEEIINSSALICKKVKGVVEKDYFWQKRLDRALQLSYNPSHLPQLKGVPVKRIFLAISKARFYTWGESALGKLGHSYPITGGATRTHRIPRGVGIPLEIRTLRNLFIVDVKAGGWSTHFLTFKGEVFSFGSMNGSSGSSSKDPVHMRIRDPVVQISPGRSHLVALTSEGEIYSFVDLKGTPLRIQFLEHETIRSDPRSKPTKVGEVKKVVGGWGCSGALVNGYGIITWRYEMRADASQLRTKGVTPSPGDHWVRESVIAPPSIGIPDEKSLDPLSHGLSTGLDQERDRQIVDFIILEDYLVFITVGGKVYCVEMRNGLPVLPPVLLPKFSTPEPEKGKIVNQQEIEEKRIDRVSGFFRRFAVYNRHGVVHMGNSEILKNAIEQTRRVRVSDGDKEEVQPLAMPSLQKFGTVVQIVFGDYHSHALTQDGKLLSWGVESQNCGCLGIGDSKESGRRGVVWGHMGNGNLSEAAEVFFYDPPYPKSSYPERTADGMPDWGSLENSGDAEEVRLDNREFCVLGIFAAGWHSGALVLPITDYLLMGGKYKEPTREVMPSIHNEQNTNEQPEIFQILHDSQHEREFDPSALELPFTGHRGIRGISSVARGMRGGLRGGLRGRGGLSGSGVVRSGADESMRQRNSDTAEAGERLGESIREAVRGRRNEPPAE